MKLGTFTVVLGNLPLDEACEFLAKNGVEMVEIGCGGFPGQAHCKTQELLEDQGFTGIIWRSAASAAMAIWCILTRLRQSGLTTI